MVSVRTSVPEQVPGPAQVPDWPATMLPPIE
jgi:hypothetical protein